MENTVITNEDKLWWLKRIRHKLKERISINCPACLCSINNDTPNKFYKEDLEEFLRVWFKAYLREEAMQFECWYALNYYDGVPVPVGTTTSYYWPFKDLNVRLEWLNKAIAFHENLINP